MKPEDFNLADVHKMFDNALNRVQAYQGPRITMATIEDRAKQAGYRAMASGPTYITPKAGGFDLDKYRPIYHSEGMDRRTFVGPRIGDAELFPLNALSLFVALGGIGKTTTLISMAAHIAAGKSWGDALLTRRRVLMFFVEEEQQELDRKFGATTETWSDPERKAAADNLRLVSCLGRDVRLTLVEGYASAETQLADHIINAGLAFGAEFIVCDHLQGFTGGDLNSSDTATSLARAANAIVAATGAAVVFTAHTNKAHIRVQTVDAGFATGNLAFENAARQVVGVIPVPEEEAKKLKIEAESASYMVMEMPKNSYGPSRARGYLKRILVPDFYSVRVEPWAPPLGISTVISAKERLETAIITVVRGTPGITRNKLEAQAGKKNALKASKDVVRKAIQNLLDEKVLEERAPTEAERKTHKLPQQVRTILIAPEW